MQDIENKLKMYEIAGFTWCDFVAHFILVRTAVDAYYSIYSSKCLKIYRCWIVWGKKKRVVIVPSVLAFASLGPSTYLYSSLADFNLLRLATYITAGIFRRTRLGITAVAVSMTVNVLATGLIIFRLFKVLREVKATSDGRILGTTGGSTLRTVMFIIIESGMALFSIQLFQLLTTALANSNIYHLVGYVLQMFNVIIHSEIFTFYFTHNGGFARV